jgi:hypothetical protein
MPCDSPGSKRYVPLRGLKLMTRMAFAGCHCRPRRCRCPCRRAADEVSFVLDSIIPALVRSIDTDQPAHHRIDAQLFSCTARRSRLGRRRRCGQPGSAEVGSASDFPRQGRDIQITAVRRRPRARVARHPGPPLRRRGSRSACPCHRNGRYHNVSWASSNSCGLTVVGKDTPAPSTSGMRTVHGGTSRTRPSASRRSTAMSCWGWPMREVQCRAAAGFPHGTARRRSTVDAAAPPWVLKKCT